MATIISEDTTWAAGEVINLSDNVQIVPEVTLTIEDGVTVNGDGFGIQTFGSLVVLDEAADDVVFQNTYFTFGSNFAIEGSIDIADAHFVGGGFLNATGNASYGSFNVGQSTFQNVTGFYIWYPTTDSSFVENLFIDSDGISVGTSGVIVAISGNTFVRSQPALNGISTIVAWADYGGTQNILVTDNNFLEGLDYHLEIAAGYSSSGIYSSGNYFFGASAGNDEQYVLDIEDDLQRFSDIEILDPRYIPNPNAPILNNAPTGSVAISGTATEDQTLTLTSTVADADGIDADTVSYQWLRDGSAISGATSSTYVLTQDDVGENISASVSYTDGYDTEETVTSAATSAIVNVNDAPVVRYEIDAFSFDFQDGFDAEAVTGIFFDTSGILSFLGTADATISYTYDDHIGYGVDDAIEIDTLAYLDFIGIDSASLYYAGLNIQLDDIEVAFASSFVDGGDGYNAIALGFNEESIVTTSYPHRIVFSLDQSSKSIKTEQDFDAFLSIVLGSEEQRLQTLQAETNYLVSDLPNFRVVYPVSIAGELTDGSELTAGVADWIDPDGTSSSLFEFQWQRDGTDISGATSNTLTLSQAEVGKVITVVVSYTDDYGTEETVTSAATSAIDYGPNVVSEGSFDLSDLSNSYNLTLSGSGDYYGYGNDNNNSIIGNSGANTLKGNNGNDVLSGKNGNDKLQGGKGKDTLEGGKGKDTLDGGGGKDKLYGGAGKDTLDGGTGKDTLDGGGGKDKLYGGSGKDTLEGGKGKDTLQGDAGKDTMFGGSSADTFVFTKTSDSKVKASKADVIKDFEQGKDHIDLSAIDASTKLDDNNKFTFDGTTSFGTSNEGDIYFKQFNNAGTANDYTMVYIDTDNDRGTEMSIKLMGLHNLTTDDFIL